MIDIAKQVLLDRADFDGVKTGFNNLDSLTGGLANRELIVMGARPGMGKTTFAYSLLDNVCINGGKRCVMYTGENSAETALQHIIRIHANVGHDESNSEEYADKIIKAAEAVRKAELWIVDSCYDVHERFYKECRDIAGASDRRIDLIIIDDFACFVGNSDSSGTISELKHLAEEQNCPVFVLSGLSRAVEDREKMIPQIYDLFNGYSCDLARLDPDLIDEILFLKRDAYYDGKADKNTAWITIAKHKKHRRTDTSIFYDPDVPKFRTDLEFNETV